MFPYERKLQEQGKRIVIGVDEAGRGPLAGPVVAAAVFLSRQQFVNRIDDSKKLTPLQRERSFCEISASNVFGIGIVSEKVIDRINILNATMAAMEQAVFDLLRKIPGEDRQEMSVLVDGNRTPSLPVEACGIVNGDARCASIAAASILAKVTRDRIMAVYDRVFPSYGFGVHKGYGTQAHRRAIRDFGRCMIHRESFSSD
jgi:ribonuclease HII